MVQTFSFSSVSCLRDAARASREPSSATGGGEIVPLRDGLRAPGLLREDERRGETAARAVAPLGIDDAPGLPEPDTTGGDRREAPGGREAVVADMIYSN